VRRGGAQVRSSVLQRGHVPLARDEGVLVRPRDARDREHLALEQVDARS